MAKTFVYFFLQAFLIVGIKATAYQTQCFKSFIVVLKDGDSPEGDDTPEISREFSWFYIILINHTERAFALVPYGIYFMTVDSGMKVEFAIGITMTYRNCIGITSITYKS